MKQTMIALSTVGLLGACVEGVDKKVLADAAIAQVQALNAAGVDPVTLDPEKLALLASGCALAPLFHPEMTEEIIATCAVVQEAAK